MGIMVGGMLVTDAALPGVAATASICFAMAAGGASRDIFQPGIEPIPRGQAGFYQEIRR